MYTRELIFSSGVVDLLFPMPFLNTWLSGIFTIKNSSGKENLRRRCLFRFLPLLQLLLLLLLLLLFMSTVIDIRSVALFF